MIGVLAPLGSIKVKLGALVAASVLTAILVTWLGVLAGVPVLLVLPVTVALALGVTQLLAAGMVSPLREMTQVAQRMARGDYSGRVTAHGSDEVARLAATFNQMASDLAIVDRERRDLIATVSHELRTPLTAMTAVLENLADGFVPADQMHLDAALAQAESLRDLVADLLELSRLEAGVVSLDCSSVSVRDLAVRSVEQVHAAGRGAEFDVRVPVDLVVDADPTRLAQLLRNVLDNAGRHSPVGAPVRVTGGEGSHGWWLEVTDSGGGVHPSQRERVFDRFGTQGAGGGTGLGLAVSRWVAELHGGTLRFVDPSDGRGACIRLDVPLGPRPTRQGLTTRSAEESTKESTMPPVASAPPSDQSPTRDDYARPVPLGLDSLFGSFWPEDRQGTGLRTVLAAAVAGVVAAVSMSFTEPGISWTLLLLVAGAAALLTSRRRRERWTLLCAGLATLLVLPLTLLAATWIGVLCVLAAAAVFLCGLTGARTPAGFLLTGVAWPLASLRGLPWFGRSLRVPGTGALTPAVLRTVVWSFLGLAVFGALFASADALFASWVDGLVPTLSFGDAVARAFVGCGVFALTLAAAYLGLNPPAVDAWGDRPAAPLRNRFEWLVPVLVVDLVFAVFLASQAAAFFGGHDYVERTTGLTYADNVHQGFGQLTFATALTLLVVWVAARRAGYEPRDRWWLRGSLGLLCAMTLVVVASALHRMHVYQEAYGFTTLRVFVDVFEGWLGFVVLAVMGLGAAGLGRWVPRVALVSGAVALLGLAGVNPDAWVADRNIDRYETSGKLDLDYLRSLSPDAAQVIAERLPDDVAGCVLAHHLINSMRQEALGDPRAWNLGRERAEDVVRRVSPEPTRGEGPCVTIWEEFQPDHG